jgi:glycosyltransferase involved in cell wall biosynthesis
MRVAYLVNQYPGISHTFIRREILALERRGFEIARFTIRASKAGVIAPEDKEEASRTRSIVGAPAATIAASAFRSLAAAPLRSVAALLDGVAAGWRSEAGVLRHLIYYVEALVLAAWLRDQGIAHAHAHFGTNSATVAMLAAKVAGASFSMTVHGPEEFDKADLIGLSRKIRSSRFTFAVSNYGVSQLRRLVEPAYWDRIRIVRCGVERSFHEGRLSAPPSEPRLVSIGRLSPQKGQMTLLEAAATLKREGLGFHVVLIGDGEMRGELESAAARFDVRDCVTFAGWKTPAEVRAEIVASRALVLPSYAEGLPVSIMEALSLERPVIATWVAGIPELVTDGVDGWLAPATDAVSLAAAMRDAISSPPERLHAMGRAGRERVLLLHDIDRIAEELEALFADASGGSAP